MAAAYSLEDVLPRMATLLGEGTGARQARVWLKIGDELRPAASWGEAGEDERPLPAPDGQLRPWPERRRWSPSATGVTS